MNHTEWAIAQGHSFARAAREGFDIRNHVVDAVASRLAIAVAKRLNTVSVTLREGSRLWEEGWLETRAPDVQTVDAHVTVASMLTWIDYPDDVTLDLYPPQRYHAHRGAPPVTVILVKVRMEGLPARFVLFPVRREEVGK